MNKVKTTILTLLLSSTVLTTATAQSFNITIKGRVCDTNGKGIPDVVVNDGVHFIKTDIKGSYSITPDTMVSKFIEISTPATYELPQKSGIASGFYVTIKNAIKGNKQKEYYEFKLKPRKAITDKFFYIAISDPQMLSEHDFNRWNTETVEDLKKETVKMKKEHEVVGATLGDLVFENIRMWGKYKKSIENLGMTLFNCIGNHDFDSRFPELIRAKKGSFGFAEMNYYRFFGPACYSFNIGKIHIITVKNIDYMGRGKYVERMTPGEIAWLKKDLSFVPKGSTIFVNMHAAAWNKWDKSGNLRNFSELESILREYDAHVFCGHTHYYENEEPAGTLYQHNIGAACGAWWFGDVNRDGAPNGYLIVDVNGKDIKWHYKSTKDPISYQFRIYRQGEFRSQKDYIIANVWDYDNKCKMEWYQDGKLIGNMDQFLDQDENYLKIMRNKNYSCHTSHLFRVKPSAEAKNIELVFTNRFGEKYAETINLK